MAPGVVLSTNPFDPEVPVTRTRLAAWSHMIHSVLHEQNKDYEQLQRNGDNNNKSSNNHTAKSGVGAKDDHANRPAGGASGAGSAGGGLCDGSGGGAGKGGTSTDNPAYDTAFPSSPPPSSSPLRGYFNGAVVAGDTIDFLWSQRPAELCETMVEMNVRALHACSPSLSGNAMCVLCVLLCVRRPPSMIRPMNGATTNSKPFDLCRLLLPCIGFQRETNRRGFK